MVDLVAWMVLFLLVAPPLALLAGALLFAAAAALPDTPRRLRESFWCPFKARIVTADFLVPARAAHAAEVAACSAFPGGPVRCQGACRALTEVRWGASRALFPRWALTADGPVAWRSAGGSPPAR
jgi:hypothetical protein